MADSLLRVNLQLTLKSLQLEQGKSLYALTRKNRHYLRTFLPWADQIIVLQDTLQFIEDRLKQQQRGECETFLIEWQTELVGVISLEKLCQTGQSAEVGYWLDEAHQGLGIVSLSLNYLIDHFSQQQRITCFILRCLTHNQRSNHIAERNQFKLVQVGKHDQLIDGVIYDINIYQRLQGRQP